jgi:multidrug efflux system outer membrane protein
MPARRALALLAAMIVAGCTAGPDYRRPDIDAPASFPSASDLATNGADAEWWKQVGDPVLDALIAEALANNRNVKIAAANVEQAAALLVQTRSAAFPQVGYAASAQRARNSESGASPVLSQLLPNPQTAYQAALSASWELDLWGRVRRASEAARATVLATDEARRGVVLSLVGSVASGYVQLRGLDAQRVVAQSTLGTYAESVRLFELRFKYGQVSRMNVAQAQSQYESAAAAIPQIESQIVQTENALSILLGRNPGPIARGKTLYELALVPVPAGVPSTLLERRPDLLEAEQRLIAANAQIGAAKALYFPTISLTGALGTSSGELANLFSGPARVWSFAGQLAGPILTFGAISGQVAQAEAAQRAAVERYRTAIQSAFADVDNALIAHRKLVEQLEAQQRLVASLKDYSRLARLQYEGGYAPYSTVLQAEQSLFPAELNLAVVQTALHVSGVELYKAMGGGWVTLAERGTPASTQPQREPASQPWF